MIPKPIYYPGQPGFSTIRPIPPARPGPPPTIHSASPKSPTGLPKSTGLPKFRYDFEEAITKLFNFNTIPVSLSSGVSIILPFRGRTEICLNCIQYLIQQNIQPLDIIVVEEDSKRTLPDLPKYVRYIFIQSENKFNKSKAINVGVENAKYDYICMNDIDMIMQRDYILNIHKSLLEYDSGSLGGEIFYLTKMPSQGWEYSRQWTNNPRANFWFHGGNIFFNRKAFMSIGGMYEGFVGHGSEDSEFYERLSTRTKFLNNRCLALLHMPHDPVNDQESIDRNLTTWNYMKSLPMDRRIQLCKDRYSHGISPTSTR